MGGEIIIRVVTKCHYFGSDALYNDDHKRATEKIPRDGRVTDNFAEQNAPIGLNGKVRPSGISS